MSLHNLAPHVLLGCGAPGPPNGAIQRRGSPGKELYQSKQRELLASQTHLIELTCCAMAAIPWQRPKHTWNNKARGIIWFVCIAVVKVNATRFGLVACENAYLEFVCLYPKGIEMWLDIQAIFTRYYDDGAYERRINYEGEPQPLLSTEDTEWAHELLRAHGLRGLTVGSRD